MKQPMKQAPKPDAINHTELAQKLASLTEEQQDAFIKRLPPGATVRVRELLGQYATDQAQSGATVELLPHQRLPAPEDIKRGAVLAGGRGAGKSFAAANYLARVAESTPKLRARVIAPTLSDAVNAVVLDPQSGILAQSPGAVYKSAGAQGARVEWPNGSICFMVGTPTLKDVDRLRALTNIDLDHYEEAAANPRLSEAVAQADLSRRGNRLHHPIWIASTTPRSVPKYKEWMKDPDVLVQRASTADNPHTPDSYREYAESLKGTHLYRQEILGEVVDDMPGALWKRQSVEDSIIHNSEERQALLKAIERVVVGVDPPSGHGTCGIVVVGATTPLSDPTGKARIIILDDFSISDASPFQWGNRVVQASLAYGATVLAERNQGGLMVESTIRQAAESAGEDFLTVTLVHAAISKERRAAPMALLWEVDPKRGLIAPPNGDLSRVATLIDQFTSWVPGTFSPDNLDAAAHATQYLLSGGVASQATLQTNAPRSVRRGTSFRSALMGKR